MIEQNALLAGPRGRRMLLEFLLTSELSINPGYDEESAGAAIAHASYELDPGRGRSTVRISIGGEDVPRPVVTPAEAAQRMAEAPLAEVTPALLRNVLANAVQWAMYWQEPDGKDILIATDPVRSELPRVAEHIARSSHTDWWESGPEWGDQWSVHWEHRDGTFHTDIVLENLEEWRDKTLAAEAGAARARPSDPTANFSGEWWSIPPQTLPHSSRTLFDGTPACLLFVEDGPGARRALTRRLYPPPTDARVYEIDGADAWADLCRRYPLEQSAQKRHDWYRTTGRIGRWVMPDWSLVAQDFDGVHLTVAGYLAAAGTAISVDCDTASVIAGWDPDMTWWFRDVKYLDDVVEWSQLTGSVNHEWRRHES